jgi:hypothetical protein
MCNALTKRLHPCRGYPQKGGLCHLHQGFFDPKNFYEALHKHASYFMSYKQREWIKRAMLSKNFDRHAAYVEWIKADIALESNPWRKSCAAFLYELFLNAGIVEPYSIPGLWKRSVYNKLDILRYTSPENRTEKMMIIMSRQFFQPFFTSTPINETLWIVLRYVALAYGQAPVATGVPGISEAMWPFILNAIMTSISDRQMVELDRAALVERLDKIAAVPSNHSPWTGTLRETVIGMLSLRVELAKKSLAIRHEPLGEEIREVAWQPERFLAWCADIEEASRIQCYFATETLKP